MSPGATARTATAAVGAAGSRAGAGHGAGVRGGGGHGGGEVGGSLAGVAAIAGAEDAASVYGGGGGVAPVEVPESRRRSLAVAREGVGGVGGVQCSDWGRVEIVLRSDVGGARAARTAGVTSGERRCHSWKKWNQN